jgi:hypothetical protein
VKKFLQLTLLCVALIASACGGGGDNDNDGAAKSSDSDGKSSSTPAAARAACPLTDAQVGEALGVTVTKAAGSCSFYPADAHTPNAQYNKQYSIACDEPGEVGYDERLDGFGVEAYIQPTTATGTLVLVCDDAPFEITVDKGADHDGAKTAATALARLVLETS